MQRRRVAPEGDRGRVCVCPDVKPGGDRPLAPLQHSADTAVKGSILAYERHSHDNMYPFLLVKPSHRKYDELFAPFLTETQMTPVHNASITIG